MSVSIFPQTLHSIYTPRVIKNVITAKMKTVLCLFVGICLGFAIPNDPAPDVDIKLVFSKYMQYSALAYCKDFYTTQNFNCTNNCGETTSSVMVQALLNPKSEGAAYVAYNHGSKTIIVVFRGMATTKNTFQALMFAKVDTDWDLLDGRKFRVISIN